MQTNVQNASGTIQNAKEIASLIKLANTAHTAAAAVIAQDANIIVLVAQRVNTVERATAAAIAYAAAETEHAAAAAYTANTERAHTANLDNNASGRECVQSFEVWQRALAHATELQAVRDAAHTAKEDANATYYECYDLESAAYETRNAAHTKHAAALDKIDLALATLPNDCTVYYALRDAQRRRTPFRIRRTGRATPISILNCTAAPPIPTHCATPPPPPNVRCAPHTSHTPHLWITPPPPCAQIGRRVKRLHRTPTNTPPPPPPPPQS